MNLDRAIALAYDLRPSASDKSIRSALPEIQELAGIEGRHWKPRLARLRERAELCATGGQWYQDARGPWLLEDATAVTLATTNKQAWPAADFSQTYASDWWDGKKFLIRCLGRITTPAGAGAVTFTLYYGVGDAPASGALAASAALAVTASQSNITWRFEGYVRCRSRAVAGAASTGILLGYGAVESTVFSAAPAEKDMPVSAPAQVTGLNLNQTSGISLQVNEAATTGGTVQIHDLEFVNDN